DREPESVSKTLEYAFDDWSLARMAQAMEHKDVAAKFFNRAQNWHNVFNPQTGFAQPRLANGKFEEPFSPAKAGVGSGLTHELGGDAGLVKKLDEVFDAKIDPKAFAGIEDVTGLIGWYAHGNEPSHHIAYLYDYAGQPWKTQERLAEIMRTQYAPTPTGLAGNDDLGQMSAWYIFTALGFYPVAPASNQYVIGRPFVRRAVMHLPNGTTFTITVDGLGKDHPYVGSVELNGKPLTRDYLTY